MHEALHRAEIYTRVGFDKDIIYRRWASEHGGFHKDNTKEKLFINSIVLGFRYTD